MTIKIVPLMGDMEESLYQLGLAEKDAFLKIEERVQKLISKNSLLRNGQDIIARAKILLKKKEETLFSKAVESYAKGLGVDKVRYLSFLSLFEMAAHYGQAFPELKGMLPGCTSLFQKQGNDITHSRIFDFPLVDTFETSSRLYYWKFEGMPQILNFSCEGLAPLFIQAIHECGMSFALHHKPGTSFHQDGLGIFQIIFETMFESKNHNDFRKGIKKRESVTKWGLLFSEISGTVFHLDIDGPSQRIETFNLHEISPLIFTNIPLQTDDGKSIESYMRFSQMRQDWLKSRLTSSKLPILDLLTHVSDDKDKSFLHPCSTLATVGAYHINQSQGFIELKFGAGALTKSDGVIRFNMGEFSQGQITKAPEKISEFEDAWKRASRAQSFFDQEKLDFAYHEIQMAIEIMPSLHWKNIFKFYLYHWDFMVLQNNKELSMIYKKLKKLTLPKELYPQWKILCCRFEMKLGLSVDSVTDLPEDLQALMTQEKEAPKALWLTWMKLIYPRLEILDTFSPHQK